MRISRVHVKCFRSLGDVEVGLVDYNSLIGKNDAGKSSFLKALQYLFDPDIPQSDGNMCVIDGAGDSAFVQATIEECDSHELAIDGRITVRRWVTRQTHQWEYVGKTPKSATLKSMSEGNLSKGEFTADMGLPAQSRNIVDGMLPTGRVPSNVWVAAFNALVDRGLVEWEDGWCPLDGARLRELVQPIMLEADVRGEEQTMDRGKALLSQLGDILVREAIKQHQGLQMAKQKLIEEIESISAKDDQTGRWQLDEINQLNDILTEEIARFDDEVNVEHDLQPPKLPQLNFGVEIEVKDKWVKGLGCMGNGLQRSMVFAMLRTLSRLRVGNSMQNAESVGNVGSPLCLFLIEEPELYLHPQAERKRMNELLQLSETPDVQVVMTTHSAFFVDLNQYHGIMRFERLNRGMTMVRQWTGPDLDPLDRKTLSTTYYFDPTRSAMLFADLVILVEGQTEKITVPYLAEKLKLPTANVEVVDCGGNGPIPIFQRVLERFQVRYVAWFDSNEQREVTNGLREMSQECGRLVLTDGNWETMCALPPEGNKPYKSWKKYVYDDEDPNEAMIARLRAAYNWESYPA